MITVITSFQLPKPITREEAQKLFLSTAPKYLGVAGLLRKYYVLSQDEAEAVYTDSWRALAREKYGSDPSVTYFESPVVVDNVSHEILSDE
jgi:hypothetical protein